MPDLDPTLWTIRVAMALYVATLVLLIALPVEEPSRGKRLRIARWSWTLGLVIYVPHVLCAFALHHDWSHEAAVTATAAQSKASKSMKL